MIYGIIPVGGKGVRLGLPFSKEMLPQAGFGFYNPILDHMVSKMKDAGAEIIIFVHGKDVKQDIADHYNGCRFVHIKQAEPSFAGCLKDFFYQVNPKDEDTVIFGLPDSIFEGNPFLELVKKRGVACGLFKTLPSTKVDRLAKMENCGHRWFSVKTTLNQEVTDWFWGILKFDGSDIRQMINARMFDRFTEIGHILSLYDKELVYAGSYIDLGTWENLNEYWRRFNG